MNPRRADPESSAVEANEGGRWPSVWRWTIIIAGALILCSCRGPSGPAGPSGHGLAAPSVMQPGLPAVAYTGVPPMACPPQGPPGMEMGVPLSYTAVGAWQPPGIAGPWPEDEYVMDGGDAGKPVEASRGREVRGLEMEDSVAKFDTLDGRTRVQPSNRVSLYAPRFGAVRQVVNVVADQQRVRATGVDMPPSRNRPS
jgi:hypothetical protein